MIEITRNLARQLRVVFRQTLGLTGRGLSPPVVYQTGPDGLHVQIQDRRAAVEYHHLGDLPPQRIVVPFELFVACEGRQQDLVKLESEGKNRIVASWRDGSIPQLLQYQAPRESKDVFPESPASMVENEPRLLGALRDATQCTDREAIRYALGCIQLRGTGEVAATDGRQLLLQSGFDFPWDGDALIPASKTFGCRELPRESSVAIGKSDDWVTLRIGLWTLHLAIQKESRFPNVDDVLRNADDASAVVTLAQEEAAFLAENLKRLPCDDDGNQAVTLDLNGQFCVRASSKAHRQTTELVLRGSRLSGQSLRVVSNRRFLEQALRLGFREFRLQGADGPVLAQDERRRYLWMTLKESAIGPSAGAIRIESPGGKTSAISSSSTSTPRKRPMPKTNNNGHAKASEHGNDGLAVLIEDAENLKTSLRDSLSKTSELIAGLKRHRKQSKAVQSTLNSLRQLQSLGA